ncbi:MAG: rhomboid family intramembrane serine protease [Actinomycetia bacterium]|nr:rhomboid family intramembrane serine protease [Actinomycetes bacterium]
MTDYTPGASPDEGAPTDVSCYRHPDRTSGVSCQRCERPICPDCMKSASVGFHCPECVSSHSQRVVTPSDLARAPVVTMALIAINALVFVADRLADAQTTQNGSGTDLTLEGWLFGPAVADGEWWRIVTSGFLHSGLMHVGFNLYMLWILGNQLEPAVGRVRFGGIYAASLVAGSVGVLLLDPRVPTLGASGAVFGLLGALVALAHGRGVSLSQTGLGPILAINLVLTFASSRISVGGHLGGLVGGLVTGWLVLTLTDAARSGKIDRKLARAASMAAPWIVGVGLFAVALTLAQQI